MQAKRDELLRILRDRCSPAVDYCGRVVSVFPVRIAIVVHAIGSCFFPLDLAARERCR